VTSNGFGCADPPAGSLALFDTSSRIAAQSLPCARALGSEADRRTKVCPTAPILCLKLADEAQRSAIPCHPTAAAWTARPAPFARDASTSPGSETLCGESHEVDECRRISRQRVNFEAAPFARCEHCEVIEIGGGPNGRLSRNACWWLATIATTFVSAKLEWNRKSRSTNPPTQGSLQHRRACHWESR